MYSADDTQETLFRKNLITCFVRDCGSNMVRAMRLACVPDINCTIYDLQLCVRATLDSDEDLKCLLAKCKQMST